MRQGGPRTTQRCRGANSPCRRCRSLYIATILSKPRTASPLIDEVIERHGRLDIVVAAHARSSHQSISEVEAAELDRCWAVNVRSIVLLAQRFAQVHEAAPPSAPPAGRMIWFTSGQHLAPMDGEIAHAVSKGALHQMTASINHALAVTRIVANCINPGPVDTGYATGDIHQEGRAQFPDQRWGTPEDIANLVEFLATDSGAWIRGQVIDAEGGFNRVIRPRRDDVVTESAGKLTGVYRSDEMERLRSEWD